MNAYFFSKPVEIATTQHSREKELLCLNAFIVLVMWRILYILHVRSETMYYTVNST
jgi:hypothetical protein